MGKKTERIAELERRVLALERRVTELERQGGKPFTPFIPWQPDTVPPRPGSPTYLPERPDGTAIVPPYTVTCYRRPARANTRP